MRISSSGAGFTVELPDPVGRVGQRWRKHLNANRLGQGANMLSFYELSLSVNISAACGWIRIGPEPGKASEAGRAGMTLDEKQLLLTLTQFSLGLALTCHSKSPQRHLSHHSFLPFIYSPNNVAPFLDSRCRLVLEQENEYDTIPYAGVRVRESLGGMCVRMWGLQ